MKEILIGILILIYGLMFYIVGRTNFLEAVIIRRLQEFLNSIEETDTTIQKTEEKSCTDCTHFVGCECFDGKTCDEFDRKTENTK